MKINLDTNLGVKILTAQQMEVRYSGGLHLLKWQWNATSSDVRIFQLICLNENIYSQKCKTAGMQIQCILSL